MDQSTQQRLDSLVENEVMRGFRVKDVPEDIREQLRLNGLPVIERVRFSRLNPGRRARIDEVVQRRYNKDLKDKDLLSDKQIRALVEDRGEWGQADEDRMAELQEKTKRAQDELYLDGIQDNDWHDRYLEAAADYRGHVVKAWGPAAEPEEARSEERVASVFKVFDRWVEYLPDHRASYTERHVPGDAVQAGVEEYSPDRDFEWLIANAPSQAAAEHLGAIDDLRDKLVRFLALRKDRTELMRLQVRRAQIFAGSIESRRSASIEMARLYFCSERVSPENKPLGPLTKTFDELWELPEDVIQWFLIENYFFLNGIPDEAKEYMATFGFLKAGVREQVAKAETSETTSAATPAESTEAAATASTSAPTASAP